MNNITFLLERGEERLIEGVQRGQIPLTTALEIARAANTDKELGTVLQQAYESGQLRGRQLIEARRLVDKREELGPGVAHGTMLKGAAAPALSPSSLVRTFQKEVARKKQMVVKHAAYISWQFISESAPATNPATHGSRRNSGPAHRRKAGKDRIPANRWRSRSVPVER